MKYEIRKYGDPVLRENSKSIAVVDDEIHELAEDMLETMYGARGLGLAAQQIGETRSICVVDVPEDLDCDPEGVRQNPEIPMPLVLINPKIDEFSEETDSREEGCLSFPEINAPIVRPSEIDLTYTDRDGNQQGFHARGLLARAVQHELDHLNGVLFIDKMSQVKKISLSGRLKRMRKETEKRLGL